MTFIDKLALCRTCTTLDSSPQVIIATPGVALAALPFSDFLYLASLITALLAARFHPNDLSHLILQQFTSHSQCSYLLI
jgi:hypothetical protein